MGHWIIFTILGLVSGIALATDTSSKRPTLIFEIAVPRESEFHKAVSEALKDILNKQGYDYQTMSFPPNRGLQELKAGRVDGTVGRIGNLAKLLESSELIRLDVPIALLPITRWCRKDLLKSEHDIKLGAWLGTLIHTILKELLASPKIKLEEISHQKGIFK